MTSPSPPSPPPSSLLVPAARHICQEARFVLTSLRGGPPLVARGELAQDLFDLRTKLETTTTHVANANTDVLLVARPFLQVVMDPRASGPHTLVALRAIHRLLSQRSFQVFGVSLEQCLQGVLSCQFEQTNVAADEAVEMVLANCLGLLIELDTDKNIPDATCMDAVHTVFVTRSTFGHSPALSCHLEDVLQRMVATIFAKRQTQACRLILEFLVNQLLHTPLVGGQDLNETIRETQVAHDATRTLCLRLTRTLLQMDEWLLVEEEALLTIVQDDLCLSLLMTGQAIWAYHETHASPGFVSLEVLSEICATIAALWNSIPLRKHLISQFEAIFTGFYTRALVLLRKRKQPTDSASFNANASFDVEVEIILESLVDILCLHDHQHSIAESDGGALETLFAFYDCQMRRSDVASGLLVELCRCCGGTVDEEGEAVLSRQNSSVDVILVNNNADGVERPGNSHDSRQPPPTPPTSVGGPPDMRTTSNSSPSSSTGSAMVKVEHPRRQVPAHLKELCAQTLTGGMRCLFRDDKASAETLEQRAHRQKSIMLRQVGSMEDQPEESNHKLRDIKSKKRLMRKAARIFNKKASRGIEFLADSGLVPDPVTPQSVALFLRTGIVVGIDKKAVGAYLGESGKGPSAGKSPPCWERDWFHKEVLESYCGLFRFENQTLIDGLRMFLACFRLPGEAQQIDRILQAFSDTCSRVCEESKEGIFSDDPKRASDAAYLLSFSIIMLNTDRHNANIREDRKMSKADFVKNNNDYGRDITEKGKEFPAAFLESIYDSIRDEEIRTEGEGADGAMTVERWKDVLRGSTDEHAHDEKVDASEHDAEDLTELVLEHAWKPIVSAIGALWGVRLDEDEHLTSHVIGESGHGGGMLGVQGARLGMDLAVEMLQGVRKLGRIDIFRKVFNWVCDYSGLLAGYITDSVDRAWTLTHSVESQSAVVVALTTAAEAADLLDEECWKHLWFILFELRDLKLIPHRSAGISSILAESEPDLLTESARRDWTIGLIKGDMDFEEKMSQKKPSKGSSIWGAIFGSDTTGDDDDVTYRTDDDGLVIEHTLHGKNEEVVWNDSAPSDAEDETDETADVTDESDTASSMTPGSLFESQLIRESLQMSMDMDLPVTGLERMDETRRYQVSQRSRVRERFRRAANLSLLVSETRFLDESVVIDAMESLINLVAANDLSSLSIQSPRPSVPMRRGLERQHSDSSSDSASFSGPPLSLPISPASKAFAEVLLCEIALKNKSRLKVLWSELLQSHYLGRLTSLLDRKTPKKSLKVKVDPSIEKCVTGLLRITICAVQRDECANEILSSWKYLLPKSEEQQEHSPLKVLDKHFGEGLWRIVSQVDGVARLNGEGWEGLVALMTWCANRGGKLKPIRVNELKSRPAGGGFKEDDPALQTYRSLHHLLHAEELDSVLPNEVAGSLCILVRAGERRNYAQLSIASLDLFQLLLEKRLNEVQKTDIAGSPFWPNCWRKCVEGIASAAEFSPDSGVRQHALSMMTDLFLDKGGYLVPSDHLCGTLSDICIPLAGRCILMLQQGDRLVGTADEFMIEFELCIGLMFKPMRHHLQALSEGSGALRSVWQAVLIVLESLLGQKADDDNDAKPVIPSSLQSTMHNLANEHLRNAIVVLCSAGFLQSDDQKTPGDNITSSTWESIQRMGIKEVVLQEWKQAGFSDVQ